MITATDESHRLRARRAINAARRGHLPKPKASITTTPSASSSTTCSSSNDYVFETARENSIEVYDDKFGRNSILTRSARMRKFKFYQYKPIQSSTNSTPTSRTTPTTTESTAVSDNLIGNHQDNNKFSAERSPQFPEPAILIPRVEVLQGKVGLVPEQQSEELSELDNQIVELEKKIADLNKTNSNSGNNGCNLDEIFDLVNKKNDLLRRQMQLNILEQEKVLEKANAELTKELRSLISIDDSKKTKAELERQQYLYDQSLALVNRRNELVLHMDVQEKGIDDDNALKESLKSVISNKSNRLGRRLSSNGNEQNCCVQ